MAQSLTALYLQNPQLANALRRQQEGAQMMQQGGDTSPIQSPFQGLARLAQGLIGGYQQGQADKDIKASADADKALMAQLLAPMPGMPQMAPEGPPQQPMTAPQQPVAQRALAPAEYEPLIQQASQQTGIPANILTGLFAQESGFRPDARNPRSTATGIGQVLDSTAASPGFGLPPLSPEARLDPAQAIPWSAQYLAARAKGLGVSDWNDPQQAERALRAYGENTPEYARAVMQRAGMGGASTGDTIPAQAPGQMPAPRTPDAASVYTAQAQEYQRRAQAAIAGGRTDLAGIFQQQAAMAQQMAMARAPQPDEMTRLFTAAGIEPGSPEGQRYARQILERKGAPPTTTVNNNPENYAAKAAIDDYKIAKKALSGANERATLFDTALGIIDSGAFLPGATSELRLKLAQFGAALGLDTNAPAGEVLQSVQRQVELANTPKGEGQITENERLLVRQANNIMGSTPEGARMLIEATRLLDDRDRAIFKIYNDSARKNGGVPSLIDVNEAIAALPPALPPEMVQRMSGWKERKPDKSPQDWSIKPVQ